MAVPYGYAIRERIKTLAGGRIYPTAFPPGAAMPCITYRVVDAPRELTHDPAPHAANPRIQMTYWSKRDDEARSLAAQAEALLSGQVFRVTVGGEEALVRHPLLVGQVDYYQPETQLYAQIQDYKGWDVPA